MNNVELVSVLEVAVFGFAIAQVLMILHTIRRERDVKELRALVEDQRLRFVELKAWLAGLSASQSERMASESNRDAEPTANVKASEAGMPPQEKTLEWQHEVAARLRSGLIDQQATMPTGDGFKWFKDDPNEPHEIVEARRIVNGKRRQPQNQDSPEALAAQSRTSHVELERTLRAIRSLKDETDKSSTGLSQELTVRASTQ